MSKGRSTVRRKGTDKRFIVEYRTGTMTIGLRLVMRRTKAGRHLVYYPVRDGLIPIWRHDSFKEPKLPDLHAQVLYEMKYPKCDVKNILQIGQFIEV
jgi:hypothetical protein